MGRLGTERALFELLSHIKQAGVRVVITCRTASASRFDGLLTGFRRVVIQPLSVYDLERFARAQLSASDATDFVGSWSGVGSGNELLTPLLVSMAIAAFVRTRVVPAGRAALYAQHFQLLLVEAQERRRDWCRVSEFAVADLFSAVAEGAAEQLGAIERPALLRVLGAMRPADAPRASPEEMLAFLVNDMGLLCEVGPRLEFAHPSFHEYFLARLIAYRFGDDDGAIGLLRRWNDRRFSEAVVFAVELASVQGLASGSLLASVMRVTDVVRKCVEVATSPVSRLVETDFDEDRSDWVDDGIGEFDEGCDDDGSSLVEAGAGVNITEAGQALWYVARCLGANAGLSSSAHETAATIVVELILSWLAADHAELAWARFAELSQYGELHSTFTKLAMGGSSAARAIRDARSSDGKYGFTQRLCMAVGLVARNVVGDGDVDELLRLLEGPPAVDEDTGFVLLEDTELREIAMHTLLSARESREPGLHAVALMLPYWSRIGWGEDTLDSHVDEDESYLRMLRVIAESRTVPPSATVVILETHLYDFCRASGIGEHARERRIRAVLRASSEWIADLLLKVLEARADDGYDAVFCDADLLIEIWGHQSLRPRASELAGRWTRRRALDSYAVPYLRRHLV